jgi:uncharacterized membrane protein HdeD (DUF308 family)
LRERDMRVSSPLASGVSRHANSTSFDWSTSTIEGDEPMHALARNWGWVALRGVAALIFGILTFFAPAISLASLILLFGAFALADGVLTVVAAIASRGAEEHWVAMLLGGILGIGAGLATFFMPGITAIVLLYWIAAWAIVTGVAEIVTAIRLRKELTGEWMLVLAGVLSVLFGMYLFIRPGVGALAVVIWIGAYAVVLGIVLIGLAFRLRRWGRGENVAARA